jgi:hypothetical protein
MSLRAANFAAWQSPFVGDCFIQKSKGLAMTVKHRVPLKAVITIICFSSLPGFQRTNQQQRYFLGLQPMFCHCEGEA